MWRVIINSLTGATGLLISVMVAFLVTPVVVHSLGNLEYGAWEIILSVFSYAALLDLGVNAAVVRYVARAGAERDPETIQDIFSSALVFGGVIGILGFVLLGTVAIHPQYVLNLSAGEIPGVQLAIVIMGINVAISLAGGAFVGLLMGFQKHYILNVVRTLRLVLQSGGICLALILAPGPNLPWMAGISTLFSVLEFATLWAVLKQSNPELQVYRHGISGSTIRKLWSFGIKSMALMAAHRIEKQSLPILIGWVLGSAQIVFFVLPNRMLDYAYGLSMTLGTPITAHFSELDGLGDRQELRRAWFPLSRMIQFALFGVGVFMIFFGEPFLRVWVGNEYAEKGRWVTRVLGCVLFLEGVAANAISLLVASGKHGKAAAVSLVVAILSIPLGGILAWKMGILGVALSVFLARAIVLAWALLMALKLIQVSLFSHLRMTALRFVIPIAVSCGILRIAQLNWPTPGYQAMALQGILVGSIYVALSWMLAFQQWERSRLLAGLQGLRGAHPEQRSKR